MDHLLAGTVVQVGEKKAGKVGVEPLITGDEFVGESQARHKAPLLQPEDGGEGATEEDTFDTSKSYETLGKGGVVILDPLDCPVGLLLNARN